VGLQVHAQTDTVTYVYTDPQGTPLVKADASGNVIAKYDYTPYGNSITSLGTAPNGPGYTGHVNDPETGLVYMQARYYQPTGRFPSPDAVGPSPGNIYSFNRYAYANNNPIINTDPTGMYATGLSGDQIQCEIYIHDGCGTAAPPATSGEDQESEQQIASTSTPGAPSSGTSTSSTDTVAGSIDSDTDDDATAIPVAYQGYYHDELVRKLASGMSSQGANVLTEVKMCLETTCARIDIFGRTPAGELFGLEVKTGASPKFTPEQVAVYLHMRAGNLLVSPDAKIRQVGLVPGLPLPSISGTLLYQRDASSPPFTVPFP
jgi:RHS repeat-associated protein